MATVLLPVAGNNGVSVVTLDVPGVDTVVITLKDGVGEPLIESVWVEPYPDERLGLEDGLAAREHFAAQKPRAAHDLFVDRPFEERLEGLPVLVEARLQFVHSRGG